MFDESAHAGRASLRASLQNDVVAIGEHAAQAFVRGAAKLKEQIIPMALGLAEAKRRWPNTKAFGVWLKDSPYARLGKDDRAALIKLGQNWSDELAARFAELNSYSPELIAKALLSSDDPTEDDAEGEETGSEFYGSERVTRDNEAWDTIDPRLVRSLVAALPALTTRMVWEPAAGCGMMWDQLEALGVHVAHATDIAPRRFDIEQLDAFDTIKMPEGTDAIVTNPPWGRLAAPFVRQVLMLAAARGALVCMLLPLPWITGRKIADLTGSPGFDSMIVPRYRARWMTPEQEAALADGPAAPKMNHVWLVWDFARDATLWPAINFIDAPADDVADDDDED